MMFCFTISNIQIVSYETKSHTRRGVASAVLWPVIIFCGPEIPVLPDHSDSNLSKWIGCRWDKKCCAYRDGGGFSPTTGRSTSILTLGLSSSTSMFGVKARSSTSSGFSRSFRAISVKARAVFSNVVATALVYAARSFFVERVFVWRRSRIRSMSAIRFISGLFPIGLFLLTQDRDLHECC